MGIGLDNAKIGVKVQRYVGLPLVLSMMQQRNTQAFPGLILNLLAGLLGADIVALSLGNLW